MSKIDEKKIDDLLNKSALEDLSALEMHLCMKRNFPDIDELELFVIVFGRIKIKADLERKIELYENGKIH